jgi:hypothetical protein
MEGNLTGWGDPLAEALVTYKRLIVQGVAHSLLLRSSGRNFIAWELSWVQCVTFRHGGEADDWVKIKIVQRDLRVLGMYALRTLAAQEAAAAHAAAVHANGGTENGGRKRQGGEGG